MPPAKGANEGAMPIAIDNKPNIFTVSFSDEISPIIALDKTKPAAEEACKSLKNKNVDRVSEKKHPTDPNMNTKKNISIIFQAKSEITDPRKQFMSIKYSWNYQSINLEHTTL